MNRYRCIPCGYVYDPVLGDADSEIAPGTMFESRLEDWVCPICLVSKDEFKPMENEGGTKR